MSNFLEAHISEMAGPSNLLHNLPWYAGTCTANLVMFRLEITELIKSYIYSVCSINILTLCMQVLFFELHNTLLCVLMSTVSVAQSFIICYRSEGWCEWWSSQVCVDVSLLLWSFYHYCNRNYHKRNCSTM